MIKRKTMEHRNSRFLVQIERSEDTSSFKKPSNELTVFDLQDSQHIVLSMELKDFEEIGMLLAEIIEEEAKQ